MTPQAPVTPSAPLPASAGNPAARIGTYEVRGLIGSGGIGRVHVGYDPALGREVAIKSLRPELTTDANFVERFRAEAASLAKLNHPNITTLYALVSEGRDIHMVMELVKGDTLEALLTRRGRPLDAATALSLIAQAGEGLCYAHAAGVVHRDIKPANLMVTESGLLKVMDFGIARVEGSQRLTRDGSIVGTLAYMAPEQLKGAEGDARSDLYSLGVVLYEMLAGRPPFRASSDYELMRAQIEDAPPRLSGLALPGLGRSVEAAVMRALEKKPEKRFATVRAFLDALSADAPVARSTAARGLAQALRAATSGTGKSSSSKSSGPKAPAPGATRKPGWFGGPVAGLLIGSAAAAAAVAIFLLVTQQDATAPQNITRQVRPDLTEPARPAGSRPNDLFIGGGGAPAGRPAPRSAVDPAATDPPAASITRAALADSVGPSDGATTLPGPRPAAPASPLPGALRTAQGAAEPAVPGSPPASPPVPGPAPAPAAAVVGETADAEIAYGQSDFKTALAIARPLAERGDAEAQFIIAKIYDGGRGGVDQNLSEAFKWYRRAAEQGVSRAQFNVGRFYSLGRGGLPVNFQTAAQWFARAASAGDMDATFNLANLYYSGDLGDVDVARARELFAKVMNSNSRLAPEARRAYDFIVAQYGR